MDIIYQVRSNDTTVAVGHHQGYEIDPQKLMSEREKEILHQLSPRKQSEWLASRELLYRIADLPERAECVYDDFGKPYLEGINKHISISHSSSWCAAMISDRSCGIDIQVYSDTVERIEKKFLSPGEIDQTDQLENRLHHLHILWGAKESMYKAYGKKKLEFRQHIFVRSIDVTGCKGIGEIRFEDIHLLYELHFRILPEAALVYCIQHSADASLNG